MTPMHSPEETAFQQFGPEDYKDFMLSEDFGTGIKTYPAVIGRSHFWWVIEVEIA